MLEIGQLVDNKYRVLDIVGKGGMSVVYLARNERANKSWAIKEVRKVGEENLEVKKNSLIAETEMLKNLSHPNLPTIVDVIETEDTFLVVMDYIEGNDLSEILREYGAQPQEKVIEWGLQLCDVLGYLHTREKPIIYRDLKPANIMLKPDGNITLIDFGTAREIKVADANDTISLGTRGYAAPEQFGANAKTDARTDIYCLGATMYHLVTNHNPATEPYVMSPIRERNPALSAGLENIILKCTRNNPDERYQSCAELMYALEHYDTIDEAYRKKQKRKLGSFITMLVLMVVCLGIAVFAHFGAQSRKAEDINTYLIEADNEANTKDERVAAFKKGIHLDPANEQFYNGLLDLYLTTDDKGEPESDNKLSVREISDLDMIAFENDNKIQPLTEFRNNNKEEYEKFCSKTGVSCWYYYDSSSKKEDKASEWFKRYLDSVGDNETEESKFVQIYNSIGELHHMQIARQQDQKVQNEQLWGVLAELYSFCQNASDDEAVVLAGKEIVENIVNYCTGFASLDDVNKEDLVNRVNDVHNIIAEKYENADSNIKKLIERQFSAINVNGTNTDIADYFKMVEAKILDNFKSQNRVK